MKPSDIHNLELYSKLFLYIKNKEGRLESLKYNSFQAEALRRIKEIEKDNKPVRVIFLKPRQSGISTFCASYVFHKAVTNRLQDGMVLADELDRSKNIFHMYERFYLFLHEKLQPMVRRSNVRELSFQNPDNNTRTANPGLMSGIKVETAMDTEAGRSGTIHHLHLSEFAYFRNAGELIDGLFECVPFRPKTSIFIESTANGVDGKGGEFYERWMAAEDGSTSFIPVFIAWYECPDYRLPVDKNFVPTPYEKELMKEYPGICLENLSWRRIKLADRSKTRASGLISPEDTFRQEYPTYPTEAFLKSGRSVFDSEELVMEIKQKAVMAVKRYEVNI